MPVYLQKLYENIKKGNLQTNIPHEYRYKYLQQCISKLKIAINKMIIHFDEIREIIENYVLCLEMNIKIFYLNLSLLLHVLVISKFINYSMLFQNFCDLPQSFTSSKSSYFYYKISLARLHIYAIYLYFFQSQIFSL